MHVDDSSIEKALSARRCDSGNIQDMTRIFTQVNQEVQRYVDTLIAGRQRLSDRDKLRLQRLLQAQRQLVLKPVDPSASAAQRMQFDNQSYRVQSIAQALKEVERRTGMRVLPTE